MPNTPFTDFYGVMRAVLGDRQVMENWHYRDEDLLSALRSVFILGRGPSGYSMSPATVVGSEVSPEITFGDDFALIAYQACLILVGGEDGKLSYRTRSLSVSDGGDRKRDLLFELGNLIAAIRDGGAYFSSYQSFAQWAGVARTGAANGALTEMQVTPAVPKLSF